MSKQTPFNLPIVKFNNAKVTLAEPMTDAQTALFETGEELGHAAADNAIAWADALRLCKAPSDRKVLRAGFVSSYMAAARVVRKVADSRFDYLARIHAPASSSRKAKANARKSETRGRKEKMVAAVEKLSEKAVAARLVAALAYVTDAQRKHMGDSEMLEVLGDLVRILNGEK